MHIRTARLDDASAACGVLRRSIVELCALDHGNDGIILERWLANKTPQNVAAWIANPDGRMFVADAADTILRVGTVTTTGEIQLNYVAPEARFCGATHGLAAQLERTTRQLGNGRCLLPSTQ